MSRAPRTSALPLTPHLFTRRRALGALLAATLMVRQPPAASLAGGKAGSSSRIVGDTFVGRTADPEVFVAVVLGEQHVTAYVCDGAHREIDLWFYGQMSDDRVDLAATDGARLIGVRSTSGIGGWVVQRNGRGLSFLAQPATGVAGLYEVSAMADGHIRGRSSTRAVLDGEPTRSRSAWEILPAPDAPAEWQFLGLSSKQVFADGVTFYAQITLPGGYMVPIEVWTSSAAPDHVWVILLAEGEARGRDIAMASGSWVASQSVPAH